VKKKIILDHVFGFFLIEINVTSSNFRICSSEGVMTGGVAGVGAGVGVGIRSVCAGTGVGVVGVGVGCACDDSDVLDGEADPGFAGSEG
jgi:hypothetical protein